MPCNNTPFFHHQFQVPLAITISPLQSLSLFYLCYFFFFLFNLGFIGFYFCTFFPWSYLASCDQTISQNESLNCIRHILKWVIYKLSGVQQHFAFILVKVQAKSEFIINSVNHIIHPWMKLRKDIHIYGVRGMLWAVSTHSLGSCFPRSYCIAQVFINKLLFHL
jgi:hypothetical protein